jgi:hypothetical protein
MEERKGLEVVDIDLQLVADIREKLPLLKNRRADVYAKHEPKSKGLKP